MSLLDESRADTIISSEQDIVASKSPLLTEVLTESNLRRDIPCNKILVKVKVHCIAPSLDYR